MHDLCESILYNVYTGTLYYGYATGGGAGRCSRGAARQRGARERGIAGAGERGGARCSGTARGTGAGDRGIAGSGQRATAMDVNSTTEAANHELKRKRDEHDNLGDEDDDSGSDYKGSPPDVDRVFLRA